MVVQAAKELVSTDVGMEAGAAPCPDVQATRIACCQEREGKAAG